MSRQGDLNLSLASRGFGALVGAQFFSALADNALIFALLVFLAQGGMADKGPLLQELFVLPYILLAPFAGPLADRFPKNMMLLTANGIKAAGCSVAVMGANPFVAYAIVGVGACLYSPAKYGILPQMFGHEKLVKANAAMEGGTIAAILIGALLGGFLADNGATLALTACLGFYGLAALLNLFIPKLPSESASLPSPTGMIRDFGSATMRIARFSGTVRASLAGTAAFWGAGASLRLALIAWVPFALGRGDALSVSALMGALSVGIVLGAGAAAKFVPLDKIERSFAAGVLLGPVIILFAWSDTFAIAAALMVFTGILGGFYAIPLNAAVQEAGHDTVGAGRALAVQNLCENSAILCFAGLYAFCAARMSPVGAASVMGVILTLACLATLIASRMKSEETNGKER